MKLHIIGTGSAGNCYLLESMDSVLIIECGVPFLQVKKAINFQTQRIDGCIISHEHGDHFKYHKEYVGTNLFMSAGTMKHFKGVGIHRCNIIKDKQPFNVGSFRIFPFNIQHDAEEPLGFVISHEESGNILFLTDTSNWRYQIPNIHHMIVEANYCEDILDRKSIITGNKFLRDRITNSHLSIRQCLQLLALNDLKNVENIVLIHLSDSNSNEEDFKSKVERLTAKQTHVAKNGMTINLNKQNF